MPPNPYYTPPSGNRRQGDIPHTYPPHSPRPQTPYPPQGYSPQQQGGGFLSGMGGGLLSGLAGSMIGNAIFGDHGQTEVAPPREEIINVYEEAPQGVWEPNAGVDLNTGGWASAGGSWDDPGADWGDGGGGDTFGGDDGGWA